MQLSSVVYPDPKENPTKDERVTVHIEDGRFFLQTSKKKFDIITAEPPPPSFSGVVSLYTQEYFQLIYNRLEDEGIATYWLPVYQMRPKDTKAIIKGFCNVFPDCSLWNGGGLEWMMAGTKNLKSKVTTEEFQRQWQDPKVGTELKKLGFSCPEQFGSLFVADGERLKDWIATSKPLVDNFPHRISPVNRQWKDGLSPYREFMNPDDSLANFQISENIDRYWPSSMQKSAIEYFPAQLLINEMLMGYGMVKYSQLYTLHYCLHYAQLTDYIPWSLRSDYDAIEIVKTILKITPEEELDYFEIKKHLIAMAAMANDFSLAEKILSTQPSEIKSKEYWKELALRIYFLVLTDDMNKIKEITEQYIKNSSDPVEAQKKVAKVIEWSKKVTTND